MSGAFPYLARPENEVCDRDPQAALAQRDLLRVTRWRLFAAQKTELRKVKTNKDPTDSCRKVAVAAGCLVFSVQPASIVFISSSLAKM